MQEGEPGALERAVFVLREVFGYDYAELAAMLGKSEAAVRQLAHRAREHVQARRSRFDHDEERIARFFLGLVAKHMTAAHRAEIARVNGSVGLLLWNGERLDSVIGFDVHDGKVVRVHAVRNPAKLAAAQASLTA